jgi:hypothetical protein
MAEGTACGDMGHFRQLFLFHDNQNVLFSDFFIAEAHRISDEIADKKDRVRDRFFL